MRINSKTGTSYLIYWKHYYIGKKLQTRCCGKRHMQSWRMNSRVLKEDSKVGTIVDFLFYFIRWTTGTFCISSQKGKFWTWALYLTQQNGRGAIQSSIQACHCMYHPCQGSFPCLSFVRNKPSLNSASFFFKPWIDWLFNPLYSDWI